MREFRTARFIEGADRRQVALLPESLDDYVGADNPVRVVDAFVDALDLAKLGFDGVAPEATGRPGYHPATLLKIYLYGYLNQVQSSRRLERECGRNLELIWLTGRLAPDFGATTARPSARFAPASSHSAGTCICSMATRSRSTAASSRR